jgi:hypothetical protein
MIATEPICLRCTHFDRTNKNGLTCAAFPMGIPVMIVTSVDDHRKPYPGDNGILFDPIEDDQEVDDAD